MRTARPAIVLRAIAIRGAFMLVLMSPLRVASVMSPAPTSEGPASGGLLEKIILIWLIASTCEEVFYRGLLQGFLSPLATYGVRLRIVRISLPVALCVAPFGLSHLCLASVFPPPVLVSILAYSTLAGLVAGHYRERAGSLLPAIAAYMTFNVVGTPAPLLLFGASRLQSPRERADGRGRLSVVRVEEHTGFPLRIRGAFPIHPYVPQVARWIRSRVGVARVDSEGSSCIRWCHAYSAADGPGRL